jgi:hypothetical protein
MDESAARILLQRLRSLGRNDAWIEDAKDGRKIDVPFDTPQSSGEDDRQPMIATLNDVDWYIVRPTCRPEGKQWFMKIIIPGQLGPEPVVVYANDPLGVLQRADDMSYLQFAEIYQRPQPQQAAPQQNSRGWSRRPGDLS